MKRNFALLICVISLLTITACGTNDTTASDTDNSQIESDAETVVSVEPYSIASEGNGFQTTSGLPEIFPKDKMVIPGGEIISEDTQQRGEAKSVATLSYRTDKNLEEIKAFYEEALKEQNATTEVLENDGMLSISAELEDSSQFEISAMELPETGKYLVTVNYYINQ